MKVILLDGGMGQELLRRSGEAPSPLWSAAIMDARPELVRELHVDYIRSGARVITLNAYSATPERLERQGLGERFEPLQRAAINAAKEAIERCEADDVALAGCLPPLVASYRPDVTPSVREMRDTYRRIVAVQAAHVDLVLCETMSSIAEARTAASAAAESGKPVWVAMTVSDTEAGALRSGEPLPEAVAVLNGLDGVQALLLNCSTPEAIAASWDAFVGPEGRFGAYANGFTDIIEGLAPGATVSALDARTDLDPERYATWCLERVAAGASIVGGCCEVGPAHMAAVRDALVRAGHEPAAAP